MSKIKNVVGKRMSRYEAKKTLRFTASGHIDRDNPCVAEAIRVIGEVDANAILNQPVTKSDAMSRRVTGSFGMGKKR